MTSVQRLRAKLPICAPRYDSDRMVAEYLTQMYAEPVVASPTP